MGLPNFIQRAIKFERKDATLAISEATYTIQAGKRVCFAINVYTPRNEDNTWPVEVKELKAGKAYDVVIRCEQSHRIEQEDLTITSDFEVRIVGVFSPEVAHESLHYEHTQTYNGIYKPTHQFSWPVTLPKDLPTCELTFNLSIKEQAPYPREGLATCKVHIQGNTYLDTRLLDACNIATSLPENMAVLTVTSENVAAPSSTFNVTVNNYYISKRSVALPTSHIAGIAQRFPKEANISTILSTILSFSRDHAGELMKLLRQFKAACQERNGQPCLIIVDTTGTLEIPWELLEIDTYYAYLGAIMQVVRWYPFNPFGKQKLLEIKEVVYEGSVLAYLDQNMKSTEREYIILSRFAKEDLPDLKILRKRLSQENSLTQVGMVYLACHGRGGNNLSTTENLQQPDKALRALELARMPEHPEPRPFFFVNACDSARMLRGSKIDPSSFAESFLIQCASSYIGTMAPVGSNRASVIAQDILERAMKPKGVEIAEALRLIRMQVVTKLREYDQDDDAQKELINKELFYTFMYVYYGNPLARLRLLTVNSAKEGA